MTSKPPIRVLASPSGTGSDGNPYIDLLYRGVRREGVEVREFDRRRLLASPHIVHVHWPAALVRWDSGSRAVLDVVKVLGGLFVARLRGAKLVWTGHDLEPHELRRPRLHRMYFRLFIQMVDMWISLTPAGAGLLRDRYPALRRRPAKVIPHGTYRPAYVQPPTREDAEQQLELEHESGPSFLLLGQIRRYKNALPLLREFIAEHRDGERLLIAGEVRGDDLLADELRTAAGSSREVVLRLARVPSAEVPAWHGAATVVVLPYDTRSTLNSGALMLALSLNTPVVMPDSPISREFRAAVGDAWVHLYVGDASDALVAARHAARQDRTAPPDLTAFEWPSIIHATVSAYADLASTS